MCDKLDDSVDRLNSFLTTPELADKARDIMKEYQNAIDEIMNSTCQQDVQDAVNNGNPEEIFQNIEEFASRETKKRMSKYGKEFYEKELERVMDRYNAEEYDSIEFNIRCEILTGLKESLENFDPTTMFQE